MSYIKAYNSYFCVKVHLVYICTRKWVWLFFNNFVLNIFILHVFFLKLITSLTLTTAMTVCIWPFETCLLRFNLENRTNIFGMSWQKEIGLTNISVLYYWSHLKSLSLLRSIQVVNLYWDPYDKFWMSHDNFLFIKIVHFR